jgi:MFS family permease
MRLILGMALFSFLCLPFVGLFPTVARLNFGLSPATGTYKWLYATWGFGACLGALAVGTVLAHHDKRKLIVPLFLGFSGCLATFGLLRTYQPAFPVGFALGFFYFALATSMLTILQQNLRSSERARVMSLWFMAFGGTVALGNLAFGPVIDVVGARPVILFGAISAIGLAWWCDVSRRHVSLLVEDEAVTGDERGDEALQPSRATRLDENSVVAGE